MDDSEYPHEKRGTPHFALDPVPSGPLLQGARGSSCSSSELSSSEGVWLVRKCKENEGKWERRRERQRSIKTEHPCFLLSPRKFGQ